MLYYMSSEQPSSLKLFTTNGVIQMNIIQVATAATEVATEVATVGARVWAASSEIFTVSLMLWILNFVANTAEKTYTAGAATGRFYRNHLHQYTLAAIALSIVAAQYAKEGAVWTYENREDIMDTLNNYRNTLGSYFVYESPVVA